MFSVIYGFENNMPYHVHDRPFIPMPLLYKLVVGESYSRVPHTYMKMQHIHRENNNLTILASNPKNNNKNLHVRMNVDTYLVQNMKI